MKASSTRPIRSQTPLASAALRRSASSLAKALSIGLRSGHRAEDCAGSRPPPRSSFYRDISNRTRRPILAPRPTRKDHLGLSRLLDHGPSELLDIGAPIEPSASKPEGDAMWRIVNSAKTFRKEPMNFRGSHVKVTPARPDQEGVHPDASSESKIAGRLRPAELFTWASLALVGSLGVARADTSDVKSPAPVLI